METKKFTTADISATLNVSLRTAQRYLGNLVKKENEKTFFLQDVFDLIIQRHTNDTQTTTDDSDSFEIIESFTQDEYQEFHKRLSEYPILKDRIKDILNDLEYHRKSAESHNRQMELILRNLEQRNFIEAKDKNLDV